MEIKFKGTLSEFQALFGGVSPTFIPSDTAALGVVDEIPTVVSGWTSSEESIVPEPTNDGAWAAQDMKLRELSAEQREAAWKHFVGFCSLWVENFEEPEGEQPDRLVAMQDLGQGRWPIPVLVMAYETKSLQLLVEKALVESGAVQIPEHSSAAWDDNTDNTEYHAHLDYIDRVAANMVQVSHMGFPDLAGTYDYSTKWKRS